MRSWEGALGLGLALLAGWALGLGGKWPRRWMALGVRSAGPKGLAADGLKAGWAGSSLNLPQFPLTESKDRRKMEKEGLEKTFGHAVKFPGLIKMSSFRENAFGTA